MVEKRIGHSFLAYLGAVFTLLVVFGGVDCQAGVMTTFCRHVLPRLIRTPSPGNLVSNDERGRFLPELDLLGPATLESKEFEGSLGFVAPNEQKPREALAIVGKAPGGVYVSVGTERGFIGAALAPGTTHLLLLDRDSNVVRFNHINIALLKLAKDRGEYIDWRLYATHEEWVAAARERGLDPETFEWIRDFESWKWWQHVVRRNPEFLPLHLAPGSVEGIEEMFQDANYVYDDALFDKVHELAKRNRIKSVVADLSDGKVVRTVVEALQNAKLPISVLDLSNAWWPDYISERRSARLIGQFQQVAIPQSVLLLTNSADRIDHNRHWNRSWDYIGFTFDDITSTGGTRAFVRFLIDEYQPPDVFKK